MADEAEGLRTLSLRGYDPDAARAVVDAALAYNAHAQEVMDALCYCFPLYAFVATGWQVVEHTATALEGEWYELRAIDARFEGMREGQGVFVRAFLGAPGPLTYVGEYVMPMGPVEGWLPLIVDHLHADLTGKTMATLMRRGGDERTNWRADPVCRAGADTVGAAQAASAQDAIRQALGLRDALDPRYILAWEEGDLGRN